ncbi:MAG: serpin family protein, partial [Phycisphaerae bacterium]
MSRTNLKRLGTATMLVALAGLLTTGGCRSSIEDDSNPPPGELVQSTKSRVASPDVPEMDLAELVDGNSTFAFDLYDHVRDEPGNIFCSPYSISLALAMTFAGARNDTEQQMADTLRFTLGQDGLHPAFNALDLQLASRGEDVSDAGGEKFQLSIVNRIWGQVGYSFHEAFLDVLAEDYGAGLSLLDFLNAPDASRVAINDWVAEQTKDRIEDLIPPGAINTLTRMVLTNAIYFKAAWREPFDEDHTSNQPFNLLDGGQVTIEMMRQSANYGYASGEGYRIVELPYNGGELSMIVFLPDAGRFEEFESTLDSARLAAILEDVEFREVDLSLPKFTFEWEKRLATTLSAMGMPDAFGALTDFSGMT